jgi:hypothetical protein
MAPVGRYDPVKVFSFFPTEGADFVCFGIHHVLRAEMDFEEPVEIRIRSFMYQKGLKMIRQAYGSRREDTNPYPRNPQIINVMHFRTSGI